MRAIAAMHDCAPNPDTTATNTSDYCSFSSSRRSISSMIAFILLTMA